MGVAAQEEVTEYIVGEGLDEGGDLVAGGLVQEGERRCAFHYLAGNYDGLSGHHLKWRDGYCIRQIELISEA